MSSAFVKTRFLIMSDTHNQELFSISDTKHAFRNPPHQCDVLIHCGDLTMTGKHHEYMTQIRLIGNHPAELKLVIAGNHDLTLDRKWWTENTELGTQGRRRAPTYPGEDEAKVARELWTGELAKAFHITFLDEGIHTFTLKSGAKFTVYASPYQPDFYNWAFKYNHNEDRFNLTTSRPAAPRGTINIAESPVPSWPKVDIMMTHGPPLGILDETNNNMNVGCPHLLRAVTRARPRIHAFGHIHEAWGADFGVWKKHYPDLSPQSAERPFEHIERSQINAQSMLENRAIQFDLSRGSMKQVFGESTLFVNAAIMTGTNPQRPEHAPFLVDVELARDPKPDRGESDK